MLLQRAAALALVLLILTPQIALASPFSTISGALSGTWDFLAKQRDISNVPFLSDALRFIGGNSWGNGFLSIVLGINVDSATGRITTSIGDVLLNAAIVIPVAGLAVRGLSIGGRGGVMVTRTLGTGARIWPKLGRLHSASHFPLLHTHIGTIDRVIKPIGNAIQTFGDFIKGSKNTVTRNIIQKAGNLVAGNVKKGLIFNSQSFIQQTTGKLARVTYTAGSATKKIANVLSKTGPLKTLVGGTVKAVGNFVAHLPNVGTLAIGRGVHNAVKLFNGGNSNSTVKTYSNSTKTYSASKSVSVKSSSSTKAPAKSSPSKSSPSKSSGGKSSGGSKGGGSKGGRR